MAAPTLSLPLALELDYVNLSRHNLAEPYNPDLQDVVETIVKLVLNYKNDLVALLNFFFVPNSRLRRNIRGRLDVDVGVYSTDTFFATLIYRRSKITVPINKVRQLGIECPNFRRYYNKINSGEPYSSDTDGSELLFTTGAVGRGIMVQIYQFLPYYQSFVEVVYKSSGEEIQGYFLQMAAALAYLETKGLQIQRIRMSGLGITPIRAQWITYIINKKGREIKIKNLGNLLVLDNYQDLAQTILPNKSAPTSGEYLISLLDFFLDILDKIEERPIRRFFANIRQSIGQEVDRGEEIDLTSVLEFFSPDLFLFPAETDGREDDSYSCEDQRCSSTRDIIRWEEPGYLPFVDIVSSGMGKREITDEDALIISRIWSELSADWVLSRERGDPIAMVKIILNMRLLVESAFGFKNKTREDNSELKKIRKEVKRLADEFADIYPDEEDLLNTLVV